MNVKHKPKGDWITVRSWRSFRWNNLHPIWMKRENYRKRLAHGQRLEERRLHRQQSAA